MRISLALLAVVAMLAFCHPSEGNAPPVPGLPEWFSGIPISAHPAPDQPYWDLASLSDTELHSRARHAMLQLTASDPTERQTAVLTLRWIGSMIALPEAVEALRYVVSHDRYTQHVSDKGGSGEERHVVSDLAGDALGALAERLAFELWLTAIAPRERAKQVVVLLSDRTAGAIAPALPATDEMLTMWLVRHSRESLPLLLRVRSGAPFLLQNGPIPSVRTPNGAAQIAAVAVIAVSRASRGVPYLLRLLDDPVCLIGTVSQRALPVVDGKVATENMVRLYPVRDAAAGALKRLGYTVTFDGVRYQALPAGK